jgi:hypothetical protein
MERQYKKPKNKRLIVFKPGTRIVDVMKTAYLEEARKYNARKSDRVIERPVVSKRVKIIATIPGTRIIDIEKTAYLRAAQRYNAERK